MNVIEKRKEELKNLKEQEKILNTLLDNMKGKSSMIEYSFEDYKYMTKKYIKNRIRYLEENLSSPYSDWEEYLEGIKKNFLLFKEIEIPSFH